MRKHNLLLNKFLQGTMLRLPLATLPKWREKLRGECGEGQRG